MENVILHVTYHCLPGKADEFVALLKDRGLQETVRKEDGCFQYDYTRSYENPDDVILLEKWRDAAALAVHAAQPHMADINACKEGLVADVVIERFE